MNIDNDNELRRWLVVCMNKLRYGRPMRKTWAARWRNEYRRTLEALHPQ